MSRISKSGSTVYPVSDGRLQIDGNGRKTFSFRLASNLGKAEACLEVVVLWNSAGIKNI